MLTNRMLTKAVIPAAGLGTRLLTATNEQPKEMMPLFTSDGHELVLRPVVQQIFEHLFDFGIREFYFIVGRKKRAIEDHFTPDFEFIRQLKSSRRTREANQLKRFYQKIEASSVVWVNQPHPRGFGDAVLLAEHFIGDKPFLVHAGDTCVVSSEFPILSRLTQAYVRAGGMTTLLLQEVTDARRFGVAQVRGEKGPSITVERVVEKPSRPRSNLAIMAIYLFNPIIFKALRANQPGKGGEIQLTDAIQKLIENGHKVQAIKLTHADLRYWVDIGNSEDYWKALNLSYRHVSSSS